MDRDSFKDSFRDSFNIPSQFIGGGFFKISSAFDPVDSWWILGGFLVDSGKRKMHRKDSWGCSASSCESGSIKSKSGSKGSSPSTGFLNAGFRFYGCSGMLQDARRCSGASDVGIIRRAAADIWNLIRSDIPLNWNQDAFGDSPAGGGWGGVGGSGINWRVSFFPKDSSHQQQDVLRIRASVGGASSLSFSLSLWNEDSPIDPPGILRRCFKVRPKIVLTDDPCSCCYCWTPWRILAMEVGGGRGGEKERSSFFLGFSPEIDDMFSLVHRRWKRPWSTIFK